MIESSPLQNLIEYCNDVRSAGNVEIFLAEHNGSKLDTSLLDSFMEDCKLSPLGAGWKKLTEKEAVLSLEETLTFDQAYDEQVANDDEVQKIIKDFFNLCKQDSKSTLFFSNYAWDHKTNSIATSGSVLSGATFNVGVAFLTPTLVGILLVEDED